MPCDAVASCMCCAGWAFCMVENENENENANILHGCIMHVVLGVHLLTPLCCQAGEGHFGRSALALSLEACGLQPDSACPLSQLLGQAARCWDNLGPSSGMLSGSP